MASAGDVQTRIIEHGSFKIVIMNAPSDQNSAAYVHELKAQRVTDVVRTCEPTYSPETFESEGIAVHEMQFPDGAAPPEDLLHRWFELVCEIYKSKDGIIAVHCVAGLGRAPVMAAVALIEMTSMDPLEAVELIRSIQKGAINAKQLKFLQTYKPLGRKNGSMPCNCSLM